LTEPMAMGKPIITTNTPDCRETVEEGKNGLLIPVKDSMALATAIEELIADEHKSLEFGKYSRVKAERDFDEKKIVPQALAALGFPLPPGVIATSLELQSFDWYLVNPLLNVILRR